MNNAIRSLVVEAQSLNLPYVSIEGPAPRVGHGFLSRQADDLTLTIFVPAGTVVERGENLRIKAETAAGEILIIEGRWHEGISGRYPRVEIHFDKVSGLNSGKDPASLQDKTIEKITTTLWVSDLIAANAETIVTKDQPEIQRWSNHTTNDCLSIDSDRFYVRQENGLEINYCLKPGEDCNIWIPITSAIAYIHGVPCWPYFKEFQGKDDATFELRNLLNLPRTELLPITGLMADFKPASVVQMVKSVAEMFSVHRLGDEIHEILHNFVVGTAGDAVPGTLVAAAALEGLCRLLEGKIDERGPKAKEIIETAARNLGLDFRPFKPAFESWDRVRNTHAHGIFHRAHYAYPHPKKSRRSPGEGILQDLSRIAGLFHAILLKVAKYRGPVAASLFEDKIGQI